METGSIVHISSSIITGVILIIIGIVIYLRNKNTKINQVFFGFFVGLGLSQLFDGILIMTTQDHNVEPLRNISVVSLIIGWSFGSISALIIKKSTVSVLSKEKIIPLLLVSISLIIFAIIGEEVGEVHGDHLEIERNILGWIGILGAIILSLLFFISQINQSIRKFENEALKQKLIFILSGIVLISIIQIIFELGYTIEIISEIIEINWVHILFHGIIIFLGALLIGTNLIQKREV